MRPDDFCICNVMSNSGDMAPRLWLCEKHGRTGMAAWVFICDDWIDRLWAPEEGVSEQRKEYRRAELEDRLWNIAYGFLESKRLEELRKGNTYYDEEFFWNDLRQHLSELEAKLGPL